MMCPDCYGTGCPYCDGPWAGWHREHVQCGRCGGEGVIVPEWRDKFALGLVQGAALGALFGVAEEMWDGG